MKDDLLILKLLKIPVTLIKYLSKFIAMATYLPNYLLILILDSIIFSPKLSSTLMYYVLSWPLRVLALVAVVGIFCVEFWGMYLVLGIEGFVWWVQLGLTFVAFQGVLALMRHGYLTMINKYSPTKLKSPLEHLQQVGYMLVDILGLLLTLINTLLLINIRKTLAYSYSPTTPFGYLKHITRLIHTSLLDIIKLFYIKIFFRVFPWRYQHSSQDVEREGENILQLVVLLTLLFGLTVLDLVFFGLFGVYCLLHPRRAVYRGKIGGSHEKFRVTGKFVLDTLIELFEIVVILFCMPFKYSYSRQLLTLVLASQNDYTFHYLPQTFFILKLALVKIPALLCELVLFLSIYKHKKIGYLAKLRDEKEPVAADGSKGKEDKIVFKSKFLEKAAPSGEEEEAMLGQAEGQSQEKKKKKIKVNRFSRDRRHLEREYLVFASFASLIKELPFFVFVPGCTIAKLWNATWVRYLIDEKHDLRIQLVLGYSLKNVMDYLMFIPAVLTFLVLGFYDPIKAKQNLSSLLKKHRELKQQLPSATANPIPPQSLNFYSPSSALTPQLFSSNCNQIRKDILFLPLFVACRVSLLSLMGCQHPPDSVELFEYLWMLFYMKRVRRSPYFQEYVRLLKADQAAGMIKNQRERLRFWKFAHKAVRHRYLSKVLSVFMPKKRAEKAIVNARLQKNFSAIANHYWHCYNITFSLLQYLIAFIIEIIVTLFGILILMPLTLWRMPTFLILFKTHEFKKKMFFTILFPMYKQMVRDILTLFIKIAALLIFPRATIGFHLKTAFRYTSKGIEEFERVQLAKLWFIGRKILVDGLYLYGLLWKIAFVKVFWVRKRDMNQELQSNNIMLRDYVKDFLMTPQQTPNVAQLMKLYYKAFPYELKKINPDPQLNQPQQPPLQPSSSQKQSDINQQGRQITQLITPFFTQTLEDIPYLALMVFLLLTLPWRFFYIKNALFLMRDNKIYRGEFVRLLKLVAKDYQCILLYGVLVASGVKTKRAVELFKRNFKLNFYVGTLRYSHLKELKAEVIEAGHFYYSLLIITLSCLFAPYRITQISKTLKSYYKKVHEQQQQLQKNKKIYQTTIKQGKSLQLITTIGNNSLLQVFQFLDARQLSVMTQVSKYMYDTIKERDQVWVEQWQRVYQAKYPGFLVKGETGAPSYNAMCVEKWKAENQAAVKKLTFYDVALREYEISLFETTLDLKVELRKVLPTPVFQRIFKSLAWTEADGYGPEDNWPRPDDNQEFLELMNITRRAIVEKDEPQAAASLLIERPVQFLIIRLNHIYDVDTHRKKKQILFAVTNVLVPLLLLFSVLGLWSSFWQFSPFFGYKFLAICYAFPFCYVFVLRYTRQAARWVSLNPYDIVDDIVYYWRETKRWVHQKSIATGQFLADKAQRYIDRPIRWLGRKISHYSRLIARKIKYISDLFIEKVAKPLYISISHKIIALFQLLRDLYHTFVNTLLKVLLFLKKILKNIYAFLFSIVKSISKFYASSLEYSLRLALSFGTVGQLIFTIIIIALMVSPSVICFTLYNERWFVIFSTLLSMVLMVTGYKHLNRMKERVLGGTG